VFACHGDVYDDFNYMGNRNESSIGDAIVIELLNKYPEQVRRRLSTTGSVTQAEMDRIAAQLKELDNIRPLPDAPSWVLMVANKMQNEIARRVIDKSDCPQELVILVRLLRGRIPITDHIQINLLAMRRRTCMMFAGVLSTGPGDVAQTE